MNFVILHYFSPFQCCHLAVYSLKYTNTRSCHFQYGCRAKMKKIGGLFPMHVLIYLVPLLAIAALAFAAYKANYVSKMAPGSSRMQEISSAIAEGASAFLKSEYKILAVFILVLFVLIAVFINLATALCFVAGAGCSILAGFFGMRVATKANVRTANAALEHGMNRALSVAFSGGSVMGMCVVGLGLLGCSLIYILTGRYDILFGFSLGASSIALFARVGGGIYTKAADVGADLVGKVEAGIPEDDPRNPAVIADNVGDNVGDVAGMGADLFESYVGAIVSAITLGVSAVGLFTGAGVIFPLAVAAVGIFASIIATFFVRGSDDSNPHKALKMGSYVSAVIVAVGAVILSYVFFGSFYCAAAIIAGLIVGLVIGFVTEVYTSEDYTSVKRIASQSETGSATTIISGIAVGMMSTWVPIVLICVGIYISYSVTGDLYGIALAAVGMLSTTGITVAVDAYGPIADNSGGIAQMSGLDPRVREITDKLDAVGNTTAAMGKGFAIGSAALTALALMASYIEKVKEVGAADVTFNDFSLMNPLVLTGLFIGACLPFVFAALTMNSVGRAAQSVVLEVRRQFREIAGLMEGKADPDYARCVDLCTKASLKEMVLPTVIAVVTPIVVGMVLGYKGVVGLLAGATVTGFLMAIYMANAGGAWDNAKKYIEAGNFGGKGGDCHKAGVVGDTVGDPFKDTSGPAINILIKLLSMVSIVFAGLIVNYSIF